MPGKYRAYPEYKDSGIEWLSEVPGHWILCSFRHCLSKVFNGLTSTQIDETDDTVPVTRIETISTGVIDGDRLGFISREDARHDRKLIFGDILFSNINSLNMIGNCAIYTGGREIYAGMNLLVFRPVNSIDAKWLYWLIKSSEFRQVVESLSKPAINQASISQSSINSIGISVPRAEEQTTIANFLDHETAKIDNLIEKQQQLIKLLKEKRQAVISHAVTKGLNPNAPKCDSGVEWLGEVPAHWEMLKGTYIGRLFGSESVSDSDISDSGNIPFIKVSTLSLNGFQLGNSEFYLNSHLGKTYATKSKYVVFPKRGAAIFTNKVNIVSEESVIDPNLMGWDIGEKARVEFVAHLLKLRGLGDIADISTVPQINNKHIEPIKFPIPSLEEQDEIIQYLRVKLERFDQLTETAELAIELSKERRTALISAAVTGKIDVRDWQPPND